MDKRIETESLEAVMRAALAERGRSFPVAGPDGGDGAAAPTPADPLAEVFAPPVGPDQYQIRVPRDVTRDQELETRARQWFHRAGLPQGIVNGIVQEYCRCLAAPPSAAGDQVMAELAREWGPDCQRKIALARDVIARCGGDGEVEGLLADSGLGDNPWLIRTLVALAESRGGIGGQS